jgi:hypothetical protein
MTLMRKIVLVISLAVSSVTYAQYWSTLGSGIEPGYYNSVHAFANYNGELYVGGYFSTAGGVPAYNIAKWDGSNWYAVGNGTDGDVFALCVFNGELYAGGSFSTAGGIWASGIARWNGVSWSPVGNIEAYVKAMVVFNGELYAAGWFPNYYAYGTTIVKWNGGTWTAVIPEDDFYTVAMESMVVYNGALYAAGAYFQIGGGGVAEYFRITKWDGSTWSNFLTIPASYTLDGALGDILSMTVYNNELYIAGTFGMIDTIPTYQIARWNGTTWSAVGTGINPESYPLGDGDGSAYSFIKSLTVYDGALYAGGRFNYANNIVTRNIAKWDGTNWSGVGQGVNAQVYALLAADTSLYVGGRFNAVNGNNIPASKIAKWSALCFVPQPGSIHGGNNVCENSLQTYSVDTVPGATSYTWTLPAGWTGSSTINSITVTAGTNNGTISVKANTSCGNSATQTLTVTVRSVPQQPLQISGYDTVCAGSTSTYFINPVAGASSYSWGLPTGWTNISFTDSITTIAGINSGTISVTANNNCGNSIPQTLPVFIKPVPSQPVLIHGNDSICEGTEQTYFIDPVPGAAGYEWWVPIDFSSGYSNIDTVIVTAYGYGDILYVSAYNDCGSSIPQVLPITVSPLPWTPDYIEGNSRVCNGTTHLYFVPLSQHAIDYTWILPNGWSGSSTSDSIMAIAGNSGVIQVKANNSCGSSYYQTLEISTDSIPSRPGIITGNIYTYTNYATYYSIEKVIGAKRYNWFAEAGIVQAGLPGNNISAIWKKPGTYQLSVKAVNDCGVTEEQKLIINVSDFNEDDPFDIKIFPNPSNGAFYLNAKKIQDKTIRVEILTITGQTIYNSGNRAGTNSYSQFIDLQKLPQGIYIAKVILNDKVYPRRIVKHN